MWKAALHHCLICLYEELITSKGTPLLNLYCILLQSNSVSCEIFVTPEVLCHLFLYHSLQRNQTFKMTGGLDIFKKNEDHLMTDSIRVQRYHCTFEAWFMKYEHYSVPVWMTEVHFHAFNSFCSSFWLIHNGHWIIFLFLKIIKKKSCWGALWSSSVIWNPFQTLLEIHVFM
jgi:hypothetical protein